MFDFAWSEIALIAAVALIAIGLLAGLAGGATIVLLDAVEHLTYHYSFGTLLDGVTGSSPVRRALGPMVGAALAGGPTKGLSLIRRALRQSWDNDLAQQLELEADLQRVAGRTRDFAEGVTAFMQKRPAKFQGK